jgi:division/cell wall cluster transcriptional repressor MraZ
LFLGEFEHSLDDKGRLSVPARFRAALEAGLVITRGLDRCLVIWDTQHWWAMAGRVCSRNGWQGATQRRPHQDEAAERQRAELAEHLPRTVD